MRFSVGNRCLMDPNLTWDLILDLIALRGTQLDHLECSRIAVGDVAGVTAWVYIVHWLEEFNCLNQYHCTDWGHLNI